jgi:hypothetical protein
MRKVVAVIALLLAGSGFVSAQDEPAKWEFTTDLNFYFIPDDFFVLPLFIADKNKLHLEARYNYEDRETFSGWVGYNFTGGTDFEYAITPMIGGVVGSSNGIGPGLEMTFVWKGFELYTESEYVFDFGTSENNFFYNWTDLSWAPKDWFWFGLSGQRTRVYQTGLDLQRGLLLGAGLEHLELTTYFYNPGLDEAFFLVTLTANF